MTRFIKFGTVPDELKLICATGKNLVITTLSSNDAGRLTVLKLCNLIAGKNPVGTSLLSNVASRFMGSKQPRTNEMSGFIGLL